MAFLLEEQYRDLAVDSDGKAEKRLLEALKHRRDWAGIGWSGSIQSA